MRGDFTLLTIEPLGNSLIILSQAPVKGRACFNVVKTAVFIGDNVFDAAVVDALAKHEGATVLANAEFVDDGKLCRSVGFARTVLAVPNKPLHATALRNAARER